MLKPKIFIFQIQISKKAEELSTLNKLNKRKFIISFEKK
jgi:hypothetical protein